MHLYLRSVFKQLYTYSLPLTVFATGACVLIIEIVAVRILSPYFGNTIFSFSSIISVVLAALSIGYYFGGRFADKRPRRENFYTLIAVSGACVLGSYALGQSLLPWLGVTLSVVSGPLISSLLLFFVPALLLGTISPFAIKLQKLAMPKKGIGTVSGIIFFWSTFGSIFGSLLAGFVLIPNLKISIIVYGVGIFLLILGFSPFLVKLGYSRSIKLLAVLLLALLFLVEPAFRKDNYLYEKDGVYEKITIRDAVYRGRPTRFLKQDRSDSGAIFLDNGGLVYDYTKYYKVYKLFDTKIKKALVLGGGAYSMPNAIVSDEPGATVHVSEIEPSLFELSKKYFGVVDDPRLVNFIEDGRRFLTNSEDKYDLIFSDVYKSLYSVPSHFTTVEFFKTAYDKLAPEGIFVANFIGDISRDSTSLIFSEMRTFSEAFPNSYFFALSSPNSYEPQNFIFIGHKSNTRADFESLNQSENMDDFGQLSDKIVDPLRFNLSNYPVLTDDFAPTDYLTSLVLRNSLTPETYEPDGRAMLELIKQQLSYGGRYLSSGGHEKVIHFISAEVQSFATEVSLQQWRHSSRSGTQHDLTNIVARINPSAERRIILGTHYDSKRFADLDKKDRFSHVPGANDSASGTAVLLELGRILSLKQTTNIGIDLVFFDGEEGEEELGTGDKNWSPIGSEYFAKHLKDYYPNQAPEHAIIIDMVCDKDLNLVFEGNSKYSAYKQQEKYWQVGASIDPEAFKLTQLEWITDDHIPLQKAGIPSLLVIDFSYPYFHTTEDTVDKCSAKSLETIAKTTLNYVSDL